MDSPATSLRPLDTASRLGFAQDLETHFWRKLIDPWFPACVDPSGGFFQTFSRTWERGTDASRLCVFQARMTWVAATLSEEEGPRAQAFREIAEHGVWYLLDRFVAPDSGDVRWEIDREGRPTGTFARQRHAYGASFVLYALSAAARALDSDEAREGAHAVFRRLEGSFHDRVNGGYFEVTDEAGEVLLHTPDGEGPTDAIGTAYGLKSQNTHLHLLEAFAEFARFERHPLVLLRLREVQEILRTKLMHPDGWLHLFSTPDWHPVEGLVSYGHNIEAAHLLMDAAEVLDGAVDDRTTETAKRLIESTLKWGIDREHGGVVNFGSPDGTLVDGSKVWWIQAEALLGLIRGLSLPSAPTAQYAQAATSLWDWIKRHQIDPEYGGWYDMLDRSGTVVSGVKGYAWKAAYHDGRALLYSARELRKETRATPE